MGNDFATDKPVEGTLTSSISLILFDFFIFLT